MTQFPTIYSQAPFTTSEKVFASSQGKAHHESVDVVHVGSDVSAIDNRFA